MQGGKSAGDEQVPAEPAHRSGEGTPKPWTIAPKNVGSYEPRQQDAAGGMFLTAIERSDRRRSNAWLRFDIVVRGQRVSVFADSGASHCFIAQRIVDLLGLELQHTSGRVRLEGGKTVDVVGTTQLQWGRGGFHTTTECIVLNMENDLILGENFWQEYRLIPDYDTLGIRVTSGGGEYSLSGIGTNHPHLQILGNQPPLAMELGRRAFERCVRKGAQPYLYVVRQAEEDTEATRAPEEIAPLHRTTGHPALDRELGSDLLEIFRSDLPGQPPPERPQDHSIDTGDARPVNKSPYGLSHEQLTEQATQIDYLMERGLVRPSTSPWGAPVLFAKKKDGGWRMCIDYRALNAVTQKNGYPLPKIQDCLDMIGTARSFSKIDLTSGYWQINVVEGDRHKTAFNTRRGKYEFCVMPFGLTNAPATFQAVMNDLLRPYLDKFVVVYLDDILIYSKNDEEHTQHIKLVVEALRKHGFYAKPSKCSFYQKHIEFCGHIIGDGEVKMDEAKLKAIRDWPPLQTVHDVRSFLGLCAYYRRFIEDFALLAGPLYDLIKGAEGKKFKPVQMHFAARNAFTAIKNAMCSDRVLAQPDTSLPFVIETDASDFGWGAVLYQAGPDGVERPVAFESKAFSPAERNYATHERELLAIKEGLRKWRCYIENGTTTVVRTDHAGLQHIRTTVKPSGRLARWLAEFGEYKLDIRYKPGTEMIVPDTLSRRSDYRLRILEADLRTISFDDAIIVYARDNTLPGEAEWDVSLKRFEGQLRVDDEDQVYHRDSPTDSWVPYTPLWSRADILNATHKSYGHCSADTMFDIIRTRQWWPDMRKDIKGFVRSCPECQLAAKPRDIKRDEMHPSGTWSDRSQPFERWGLDLIGPLPKTDDGNKWIVTAIDYSTRWPVARAIPEATAEALADFVVNDMYRDYGAPKEIITDRGANLWAPAMNMAFELLGTKHRGTTPYHPRTNGAVERFNGTLGQMLTKYCIGQPIKNWDKYLNQALFATRIRTHTTTGFSPFYLLYGVNPRLPGDAAGPTPDLYDERIDPAPFLSRDRAEAFKKTMQRANENKAAWDAKVKGEAFAPGEMVLIRTKKSKKFEVDWYGPYEVVRKEILNTYVLKPPGSSPNKYLISGDRMKLAYVDEAISKGWRMPRGRGRPRKHALPEDDGNKVKRKRGRPRKQAEPHPDAEYKPAPKDDLEEDADQTV